MVAALGTRFALLSSKMALEKTFSPIWMVLHLAPHKRGSMEAQLAALAHRLRQDGLRPTFVVASPP